ncbi:putative phosphoglycerate mutase [Thermoflexales bacterium]|nr:putative phosphoglycerate mutase [Thermoflexales bacterium]
MKLYFVRHGQSEANVQMIISNRALPHSLTELGRQQATALAQSLSSVQLTAFYASPIVRARQTAEIVASLIDLPFEIADALREPDCGIMEGRRDEAAWAEHDRVMYDWMLQQKFDSCLAGGESFHDLRARFGPFIDRLVAVHGDTDHNILLITHGALLYLMLPTVLTNIDFAAVRELPMPNTGVIIVEKRANDLICLEWCDVKLAD